MLQAYIKCGHGRRASTLLKSVLPFSESHSFVVGKSPPTRLLCRCIGTSYDYSVADRKTGTNSTHSWRALNRIRPITSVLDNALFSKCAVCCPNVDLSKRHYAIIAKQADKNKTKGVQIQVKGSDGGVLNKLHLDESDWGTVYRFKHIRLARVIQKIKIYQTAFTCFLALPGSLGFYVHGMVPPEAVAFVLGSSVFACAMLYVMGSFCSRLIGVLYVSKNDPTLVRVAHLNFWGKREDMIVSKTDFKPFSELPDNVSDIYVNVSFYSDPTEKLHMCVRYGTVYEKEEFEEIFGSCSGLNITNKENNKPNK